MRVIFRMFSRRWILATLLVVAGAAVMVRLGIWQLDRLAQRRLFNARVQAEIDQPLLTLQGEALDLDLYNMEYRQVEVTGQYDFSQEIALRNQAWGNQSGVHLVTPLIISGTGQAILVDRGWISEEDYASGDWSRFAEPGIVVVHGVIRRPQSKAEIGGRSDTARAAGEAAINTWNFVNIDRISAQVSHPLLPVYIQQSPDPSWSSLPYRTKPELDLSEGPHQSYALQWFSFATLLVVGYPFFIRRQENRKAIPASQVLSKQEQENDER
jgi:surfeit locus 1 family protein